MPAHHKPTSAGVRDPHCGPLPGDASFRLHFSDTAAFQSAMRLAAQLEARGLYRRAWRVRWNLDGPQPTYERSTQRDEDDEEDTKPAKAAPPPPPPKAAKPVPLALDPEYQAEVRRLILKSKLSHAKLAKALGVSQQAVSSWATGHYISRERYEALRIFVEGMRK